MGALHGIIFGLGATKAGTSWLFRYLERHPGCHLRSIKELHYFDALDFGERGYQIRQLERRERELEIRLLTAPDDALERLRRQLEDCRALLALHRLPEEDRGAYLAYLGAGRRKEQALVGDFTPAYGLLSVPRLRMMAALAARVRFLLVLRDPVERLWSHVRMNAARMARRPEDVPARAHRIFWRYGRGRHEGIRIRGDYRAILARLDAALEPRQLLVLFYEELFSQKTADRICAFLGLDPFPAPLAEPVHAGVPVEMSQEQRRHARRWLAPQYEYVRGRFGRLPARWQADMLEEEG